MIPGSYTVSVTVSIRCGSDGTSIVVEGPCGIGVTEPIADTVTIEEAAVMFGNWLAIVSLAERVAQLRRPDRDYVIEVPWKGSTPRAFLT